MILYLRCRFGDVFKTVFWGLVQVDDATAEGLTNVIYDHYQDNEVPIESLASLATDGASVMMGSQSGVCVRLREIANPFLLIVHCIAHREALAAAAAATGNAVCEFFESILHQVISYHSNSSKRKEHLYKLQERLQVQQLRMVRIVATRWLSRGQAAVRVLVCIAALIMEFKEDMEADRSNSTARGLYEQTFSVKFLMALVLFAEILEKLNKLNTFLQKTRVVFGDVMKGVAAVKSNLLLYKKDNFVGGDKYAKFVEARGKAMDVEEWQFDHDVDEEGPSFNWNGINRIAVNDEDQQWVRDGISDFAEDLIRCLSERFPENDSPVIAALDVFNFDEMPKTREEWEQRKHSYGNKKIEILLGHYGKPTSVNGERFNRKVDPSAVRSGWPMFKEQLFQERLAVSEGKKTEDEAYADLLRFAELHYPDLNILLCFFLILALSSVPCERGFSTMAIIKTKLRNCLSIPTLDALMMIHLNGPKEKDFANYDDYQAAVDSLIERAMAHWRTKVKRNVKRSHPGLAGRKKKKQDSRTLADALEEEVVEARRRRNQEIDGPRLDEEPDDDDDDELEVLEEEEEEEEKDDGGRDEAQEQAENREAYGPFTPPDGWSVMDMTDMTESAWSEICKNTASFKRFWGNDKKHGHLWDNGWALAKYTRKYRGKHWFKYFEDKEEWDHSLKLEDYGLLKTWVIIKKDGGRRRA